MSDASQASGLPAPTAAATPRVSVVMTVYNDLRFLDEAVDSVLRQDFRDLELVIVDDGTGETALFKSLGARDPRIRIVVNEINLNPAYAANRGIEAARGEIIARLDVDDVCEPERIGRLVAALDGDPQLGLIGSAATIISERGRPRGIWRLPESDLEIRWTLLFHNPFCHPSVAFRRRVFERAGRYRPDCPPLDHYLWLDLLGHCRARNLAEPLVRYRRNRRGLTMTRGLGARGRTHAIREALHADLGLRYDLYDDELAREVSRLVSGRPVTAERRAAAYRRVLDVLPKFLAARRPYSCAEDALSARRLTETTFARMLASPPPRQRDRLAVLCRLLAIDPRAAAKATSRWLAGKLEGSERPIPRERCS